MSNLKSQIQILKLKTKLRSFAILVLVLSFGFCALSFNVSAQQVSLAISPPLLELIIKPGKSVLIAYKLENRGDPAIAVAKVQSFVPQGNLGNIKLKTELEGPVRFNLDNSELKLNQPFFLKTGDRPQLLLRIRVPEGAPEGDYYYTLLAETQPPPTRAGESAGRAKATIGSNLIITVTNSGKLDIKSRIASFDLLTKFKLKIFGRIINFFESSDKIPLILIVDNKGKNAIKPQGQIILRGNFNEHASYDIISQNILAESQRLVLATSSASINCPKDNPPDYCKKPVSLLLSGFFIGFYKLSTTVNFGQGTPTLYASTSFIALPLKLILGIIIALLIGLLVVKKFTKTDED